MLRLLPVKRLRHPRVKRSNVVLAPVDHARMPRPHDLPRLTPLHESRALHALKLRLVFRQPHNPVAAPDVPPFRPIVIHPNGTSHDVRSRELDRSVRALDVGEIHVSEPLEAGSLEGAAGVRVGFGQSDGDDFAAVLERFADQLLVDAVAQVSYVDCHGVSSFRCNAHTRRRRLICEFVCIFGHFIALLFLPIAVIVVRNLPLLSSAFASQLRHEELRIPLIVGSSFRRPHADQRRGPVIHRHDFRAHVHGHRSVLAGFSSDPLHHDRRGILVLYYHGTVISLVNGIYELMHRVFLLVFLGVPLPQVLGRFELESFGGQLGVTLQSLPQNVQYVRSQLFRVFVALR
mmetsp:Transcript_6988/g.12664  ORF Transcript_6988/g.12664 Transcript_6988/m.12664 type:complete len:346 (+) Transcript_6988:849-1886(+)